MSEIEILTRNASCVHTGGFKCEGSNDATNGPINVSTVQKAPMDCLISHLHDGVITVKLKDFSVVRGIQAQVHFWLIAPSTRPFWISPPSLHG